uniref:Coronin n=1 Tax=Hirondellea gigas TaxID=1518452 RepID=A0A6A7G961_9CRUS
MAPRPAGSFRGVRQSKFRHLVGISSRNDKCYQMSESCSRQQQQHSTADASNTIDVNTKFLALAVEVAGGGAFVVLPLEKTGRIPASFPRVVGHRGAVTVVRWCPHNDNLIASASDDATVKLWHIPDAGLRENAVSAQCVLEGHSRRVTLLLWHPTADGVLFSAGLDRMIYVWDTATGECLQCIDSHPDAISSMALNRCGSLLATTSRDKKLRIIDPRTTSVLQQGVCHEGSKSSVVVYLGDSGRVATVGFGRHSERQLAVWDETDLTTALRRDTIDTSSGVLVPFYDYDTALLFVAGKGDGNIRFYEITDEAPYFHYLNQFISGEPQRGLGVLGKRGCRVLECEILRFYKLHATRPLVQPISFIVPRKQSGQFQPDLFPDTAAPTPAITAAHWLAGLNSAPLTMSLTTGVTIKTHRPVPIRACDIIADKNAAKKFQFLSSHTRADYRPKLAEHLSGVTGASSEKDLKTSCNLDTKFQSLQRMWAHQNPDEQPPPQHCNQPAKPQHTLQYQQQQELLNKQQQQAAANNNKNKSSDSGSNSVLAAIRKLEVAPPGKNDSATDTSFSAFGGGNSTTAMTEKMLQEIMMEKPCVQSEAELKLAYISQCAEVKLLRRQLLHKDRQIRELQLLLDQSNTQRR